MILTKFYNTSYVLKRPDHVSGQKPGHVSGQKPEQWCAGQMPEMGAPAKGRGGGAPGCSSTQAVDVGNQVVDDLVVGQAG